MLAAIRRHFIPLLPLLPRALVVYAAARGTALFVGAFAAKDGGGATAAVSVVALATALGVFDLHRRKEQALWHNLGYSMVAMALLFAVIAATGELIVSTLR
jgi:hypothetical protein